MNVPNNTGDYFAIITGASSGLGTSFTLECASRGYNLFLISLPGENLLELAECMRRNYPITVHALELDIVQPNFEEIVYSEVMAKQMKPGLLINNAGMSSNNYFENTSRKMLRKLFDLNCMAGVALISILLPEMKKLPKSYIINVSSVASYYSLPFKACYAATKGFIRQYSQALRQELAKYNIVVSILCPGPMTTNINNYRLHREVNWISRQTFVHPQKVAAIGLQKALNGQEVIIPGFLNRVLIFIATIMPPFLRRILAANAMKQLDIKPKTC